MDIRQQFKSIYAVVKNIPQGRVMSYGQVAAVIGSVNPRTVGWALANDLDGEVPWQRVVGAGGYLRIGRQSTALMSVQRNLLEREGVSFLTNGCVDMGRHQWDLEDLDLTAVFTLVEKQGY